MKKFLLVLFALISLNSFAQLQVKEGSFKYVPGGVIEDKLEYTDGNDLPMALIKISTENIPEQERMRLVFVGNRATQIIKRPKTGSMWIYISADPATFIDIRHPDYGTYKFLIPEKLCDYCVYEMVLQYVPLTPAPETVQQKKYHLVVSADQSDATIYIDDEPLDIGQASKLVTEGTTHTYKIECNLYYAETGSVTVKEKTVIEKTLRPKFGYINISTAPEQGAKVFVNGEYLGVSPITTDKLKSGTHTVRAIKDMYKMKEETFTVSEGKTTDAILNMAANFVNVTINTDTDSDIYVDDEYKGTGKWTGRLSDGGHIFEARKTSYKTSRATVDLVLGEAKTFTIDAPKPIYGSLEVNSTPMNATIYIDGKSYGETPNYINEMLVGEHELKLTKQGCAELKKTMVVKEGEALTINEKLQVKSQQTLGNENVASGEKQTFTVNGVSFTMIAVEGGTFQMGATSEQGSDADNDEKPVHSVTLSDYYIGETEVTQELWRAVMGSNPSYFSGYLQRPVENVSWDDCQEFITKLNNLTGKNFRLPTEAEWEYAARGGNKSQGYKYSGSNTIGNVAWYTYNSGSKTHDVKTKHANELGIYDMSGNVYEWCYDRYEVYSSRSQISPAGPTSGSSRILRGGSWDCNVKRCRISYRDYYDPGSRSDYGGFRLSLSQD